MGWVSYCEVRWLDNGVGVGKKEQSVSDGEEISRACTKDEKVQRRRTTPGPEIPRDVFLSLVVRWWAWRGGRRIHSDSAHPRSLILAEAPLPQP